MDPLPFAVAWHGWEVQQHREPGGALHQCSENSDDQEPGMTRRRSTNCHIREARPLWGDPEPPNIGCHVASTTGAHLGSLASSVRSGDLPTKTVRHSGELALAARSPPSGGRRPNATRTGPDGQLTGALQRPRRPLTSDLFPLRKRQIRPPNPARSAASHQPGEPSRDDTPPRATLGHPPTPEPDPILTLRFSGSGRASHRLLGSTTLTANLHHQVLRPPIESALTAGVGVMDQPPVGGGCVGSPGPECLLEGVESQVGSQRVRHSPRPGNRPNQGASAPNVGRTTDRASSNGSGSRRASLFGLVCARSTVATPIPSRCS